MSNHHWRPRPGEDAETFVIRVIGSAQRAEEDRIISALRDRGYAETAISDAIGELRAGHEQMRADALERLAELGDVPVVVSH